MKIRFQLTFWTVLTLGVLGSGMASGQGPPLTGAPAAPEPRNETNKIYTKNMVFKLPIRINEAARANLNKVSLWVKVGQSGWENKKTVDPTEPFFLYKVNEDGAYWFHLVTIDKNGTKTPADLDHEVPALMVVVDTQPPTVDVQRGIEKDEVCLRCVIKDANPDYQSLKVAYRAADQTWRELEQIPGSTGAFRVSPGALEVFTSVVRVTACDLAQNKAQVREIQLNESMAGAGPALPAASAPSMLPDPPPLDQASNVTPPAPPRNISSAVNPLGRTNETAASRQNYDSGLMTVSHSAPATQPSTQHELPSGAGNRQLLNTTRATIDYRLDHVGPSGVSKVEVWMTSDQGRNWQRVCEDVDLRTPAEVDLPGEGLFGLRLVVTNGNGFGGTPPLRGDNPHYWIEVDTTAPHAQLRDIDPVANGGNLELRWTASDKNLGSEPISLFYATRREGPWVPVIRNLKNEGIYHWAFPRDAGSQFFVRLEVTDQAGNVTRCEPSAPVVLDMTEPHALVVGVTGAVGRTSPNGN